MLALRFAANCVRHESLRSRLQGGVSLGALLDRLADVAQSQPNANEVNALAVLCSNLAVLNAGDAENKTQLVVICGELMSLCQGADLLTVVAALGTLAIADVACRELVPDLDITAKLRAVVGPAKGAAEQLLALVTKK
jgi:hypothetical protein